MIAVPLKEVDVMCDLVGESLPGRLGLVPEFKVLDAIVQSVAIQVVHRFGGVKGAAQVLLHDMSMLVLRDTVSDRDLSVSTLIDVTSLVRSVLGVDRISVASPTLVVHVAPTARIGQSGTIFNRTFRSASHTDVVGTGFAGMECQC